ncbi:AlpA family transcriptional regulator [Duncaniella dubosii]|uniref:DNA-binding protein n=1 Tax=Duncaniella dubosii TaxID=2518971 RepID=A0A4P7W4K6_9BACT|nr:helix-turn-helix domain-containing protein [Duncaniella dubosii]QCD42989.1 DNA-binding protein [Duncaniella dubosii]
MGSPVFMYNNTITFDELPGAVSSLVNLVRELADEVRELRAQLTSERGNQKSNTKFIGLAEACEILGKAKSTVYRLAKEGLVPAYKVPGEKEWRFIESELVEHVKENKRQSSVLSFAEMESEISRGTRAKSINRR